MDTVSGYISTPYSNVVLDDVRLGGLIMSHFCLVDRIMLSLCVSPVMTPESGVLSPGLLGSNYQVSAVSGNVAILAILAIHGKARPSHEKQPGHQHRP